VDKNVVFVTYTMMTPAVIGGAFIRALRLATELHRRGWSPIICNAGPMLDDPKVRQAQGIVRFVDLDEALPGADATMAAGFFTSLRPAVVVFGEGPLPRMEVFFEAAKLVKRPLVMLEQYYQHWLFTPRHDVDLLLLYGLTCFWKDDLILHKPAVMVPPYIEHVVPKEDLPVPRHLHTLPWVTLIAYDSTVLHKGIDLLASLGAIPAAVITVSHDPQEARRLLDESMPPAQPAATLPLQSDAAVAGLMGTSRVVLVSNGFLQIMEALAMACPVVCIDRGVGFAAWILDDRFRPYVSIGETTEQQQARIGQWLATSPFPPRLRDALQHERGGTRLCADLIEALAARRWTVPMLRRQAGTIIGNLKQGIL